MSPFMTEIWETSSFQFTRKLKKKEKKPSGPHQKYYAR